MILTYECLSLSSVMTLDEERLAAERALFRRVIIACHDLSDTRASLNRLLGLNNQTPPKPGDSVVREALATAAVVGYGRIFTASRGERLVGRIPGRFVQQLSTEQRELHNRILELRNREFAHSDGDAAEVKVFDSPGTLIPVSRALRRHSLTEAELERLDGLCSSLHSYLTGQLVRLYELLKPHGEF